MPTLRSVIQFSTSSNFPPSSPVVLTRTLHRFAEKSGFFLYPTSRFNDFKIQKPNNKHRSPLDTSLQNRASTIRFFSTPHPCLPIPTQPLVLILPRSNATKRKESSVIYAAKSKNLCLMIAWLPSVYTSPKSSKRPTGDATMTTTTTSARRNHFGWIGITPLIPRG